MFAPLKAGLLIGVTIAGAAPPAFVLVRSLESTAAPKTDHANPALATTQTAMLAKPDGVHITILPSRVANLPSASEALNRLDACFETVARLDAPESVSTTITPANATPPKIEAPMRLTPTLRGSVTANQPALLPPAPAPTAYMASDNPPQAPFPTETATPRLKVASVQTPPPPAPAAIPEPVAPQKRPITISGDKAALRDLVTKEAAATGVPAKLALAIVAVESGFDSAKRGEDGKIGPFQIRPKVAYALGYKGSIGDLADPAIGTKWGMKYLSIAYKRAGGDTCKTGMKFIGGHFQEAYRPIHAAYCKSLEAQMAGLD